MRKAAGSRKKADVARKKQATDAARRKKMRQPTMDQVMFEMDRGRLRPLRERLEQVVLKQRGFAAHTTKTLSILENRVIRNWNDCQAALLDLLHRIVVLEKK